MQNLKWQKTLGGMDSKSAFAKMDKMEEKNFTKRITSRCIF